MSDKKYNFTACGVPYFPELHGQMSFNFSSGCTGPCGPIGATGPQGPIGITGPFRCATGVGPGVTGLSIPNASTGPQGDISVTGPVMQAIAKMDKLLENIPKEIEDESEYRKLLITSKSYNCIRKLRDVVMERFDIQYDDLEYHTGHCDQLYLLKKVPENIELEIITFCEVFTYGYDVGFEACEEFDYLRNS